MYRQGDILIMAVDGETVAKAEKEGDYVSRDNDRLILAYGESTGHAHAISEIDVKMISSQQGRFLRAEQPFILSHEEHNPISIPAGTYRVIRQREYDPTAFSTITSSSMITR